MEGLSCRHCLKDCLEDWRETPCRDFQTDWQKVIADPDPKISKMGKAEYRRICRRARREASGKAD